MCSFRLLKLASVLIFAFGQAAFSSVETRQIEFSLVRYDGSEQWLECGVEVEVKRDPSDRQRRDLDFLDGLDVHLVMGVESRHENGPPFEFYSAVAHLVSLESGKHLVRFYLPPEIVERDDARGEPHSFVVRIERFGNVLAEAHSHSLSRPSVRSNFLMRVGQLASRNDGILLPQNRTPFLNRYSDSTPSVREVGAKSSSKDPEIPRGSAPSG